MRYIVAFCLILLGAACGSAPPAPAKAAAVPVGPPFEQKMAWILRLEDQRMLRDPAPPPAPPAAVVPAAGRRGQAPVATPPPPPVPDLVRLLTDSEARIRRRAALAIGRVGLKEGVEPLVGMLTRESDPEVKQMAAFAIGLIGDMEAREPLVAALSDPSPLVQGSAAEALGLIGDAAAADPIARMLSAVVQSGALTQTPGEGDDTRRDTPTSAFRLGVYALVRLKAYPALASVVLDQGGQPKVRWWPVAFALQRLEDKRALPALLTLAKESPPYTRAFAVKGLGAIGDASALPTLMPLLTSGERSVLVETIRALGKIGDRSAAEPLIKLIRDTTADPQVRLEVVSALGGLRGGIAALPGVNDVLLDLMTDPVPAIRATALRSVAAMDPDNFITILSALDPDPHWTVRAALAGVLGTLTSEAALARLKGLLNDSDQRVIPAVLNALVKVKAPDVGPILLDRLKADDPVVRAAAATGIGELKLPNGAAALADAFGVGQRDALYVARTAALAALVKYGAGDAMPVLNSALADKDWSVRVRAAGLIKELDPSRAAEVDTAIRPAPTTVPVEAYQAPHLVNPPVSLQVYIDTDRGSIHVELAMIDAPLTVENFVTLARRGYFNGLSFHRVVSDFVIQDGDPRGDGEGGPGYTIRDELNQRPYLRGAVGMALDPWRDSGGSQWFITHSPQPHLDAKYTVFGRVIGGMEFVDQIQQWDVIRRVRVWDGQTMTAGR
jgi:HEAT repeat protein/cyclophilin family peptidyl-prolyl cis-trans isomerase